MAGDATEDVGRWRHQPATEAGPTNTRASKWSTAALLTLFLIALAAAAIYLLLFLFLWSGPRPYFVPLWNAHYQKLSSIPWMDADRKAMEAGAFFDEVAPRGFDDLTFEEITSQLEALKTRAKSDSIVVYVASYALVDPRGAVRLLAKDSDTSDPQTGLLLGDLLASMKACPASKKLLVLDVNRADPNLAELGAIGTSDGVADLILQEVNATADKSLLVLSASAPGQPSLSLETFGRSLFNRQFCLALDDLAADLDGDNRLSVSELAMYLGQTGDRWAQHFRGTHQLAFLTGEGPDFPLIMLNRTRPKTKTAPVTQTTKVEPLAESGKSATPDATAKAAATAPATDGPVYPQWLAEGWEKRAKWWAEGVLVDAPRVFRALDATLLRAERGWRVGTDPERVRSDFNSTLASIEAERSKANDIPRPPIRSVGQARAFGNKADPALVAPLKELLRKRRDPDPNAKPEDLMAASKKASDEFVAGLKGKTSLDLAFAIVGASADDRFSPEVVTVLDSVVDDARKADPTLQRDVIELRFLHQLAARAAIAKTAPGGGDWSETTVKMAWDVVTAAEEAASRFDSLHWVDAPLHRADNLRHEAAVLLLPTSAGMTSWDQIGKAWDMTREAYEFVTSFQNRMSRARISLTKARAVLTGYLPFMEANGPGHSSSLWHDAAGASGRIARMVAMTRMPQEGQVPDPALERLHNDLAEATQRLDTLTDELMSPFRHEVLTSLANRCGMDKPDPKLGPAIDALLATPFPEAKDRAALLSAARTLDRRLAELPSNEPVADSDGSVDSDRVEAVRRIAARRQQVAADLMLTAGYTESQTEGVFADGDVAKWWGALSSTLRAARENLITLAQSPGADIDDSAGMVAPFSALDWHSNSTRIQREKEARAAWNRLGGRYLDDRRDLGGSDSFLERSGLECLQVGLGSPPDSTLEITADPASESPTLSSSRVEANISARLTWHGPGTDPVPVTLSVIAQNDPRFRVTLSSGPEVKLIPETPLMITAKVAWNDVAGTLASRPPTGFLLRARRADGRVDHLIVPVTIVAGSEQFRLVLSDDPKQVNPQPFDLRLRPLVGRQSFYVHVMNPTSAPRNVLVNVVAGDSSGIGGETILGEAKLTVAPGVSTPVPTFAATPIKPTDLLAAAPAALRIRLVDQATNKILDQHTLRTSIASPLEYLKVMNAEFRPAQPGEPNRLSVTLRAQPSLNGPPCPVELLVNQDAELFPALIAPPKGKLSGTLEPAGELTLYAEQLKLDPSATRDGVFRLDLDGEKRALAFKARFPLHGGPQEAAPEKTPRIRFSAVPEVKADRPARLNVTFLVDNAPSDAKIEFRLGRGESDDITPWIAPAKERRVGFDPRGEKGALLFEAGIADWSKSFLTAGIRGERRLQARLLDADGRTVLDSSSLTMTLDDLTPREVAFGPMPPQVAKGTASIPVSAVASVPASSVKEMTFFIGKPADFDKAVAAGASVRGKAAPSDPSTWTADLPLPATAASPLVISVRVVSGVDLVGFASQEIDLTEPKPSAADEKSKKDAEAARSGVIEGKVAQGNLPQPNLIVTLIDLQPKLNTDAKAGETKTGKGGTFTFKDVKPGKYRLAVANQASLTKASKDVTVEPAKTAKADLDLFR